MQLSSTKERIFDEALKLISKKTFESVSMRDIAEAVGIKASSLYNHYYSKQEILENFYEYYQEHIFDSRLDQKTMLGLVEKGSKEEILDGLISFSRIYMVESERMLHLTKVIYERKFSDDIAAQIFLDVENDNIAYIREAIEHGIQAGRLKPITAIGFANALVCQYSSYSIKTFVKPENSQIEIINNEQINQWMVDLLEITA